MFGGSYEIKVSLPKPLLCNCDPFIYYTSVYIFFHFDISIVAIPVNEERKTSERRYISGTAHVSRKASIVDLAVGAHNRKPDDNAVIPV